MFREPTGRFRLVYLGVLALVLRSTAGFVSAQEPQLRKHIAGLKGPINALAFRPDGKTLAAACQDGTIPLWDVQTGKKKMTLKGHAGPVLGLAFRPDGKMLASASADRTVKLWDTITGMERTSLPAGGLAFCVAFRPDGNALAWGGLRTVTLAAVPVDKKPIVLTGHRSIVAALAYSPDGKTLASGGGREIKIWDAVGGKLLSTWKEPAGPVNTVAFAPDGKRLVAACATALVLWDVAAGKRTILESVPADSPHDFRSAAVGPKGLAACAINTTVPAGTEGQIKLWHLAGRRSPAVLKGYHDYIRCIALSPDGRLLASGGGGVLHKGKASGEIKMWEGIPVP
jgi:WD40 repeat protein